ncbi:MAG: hypothetical protein ACW99G_22785 [Candidatus Thorarchaeota archaeon]|jgi:hypothetical protein
MHISLDAALQRQPLLSTVGDKLLPAFPGAAAAYSLRALNGDANDVVKVRRDADNEERDFTAEGVSLELADWVNGKQESTLPADVATAAAAYSLRKVKAAYSGNAVRIRRESDDVEVDVAFDSNGEVSTSSAITNVTESPDAGDTTATTLGAFLTEGGNQDATVQTWYDQAGSLDATQDTAASQPKIAEAGSLVTKSGKPSIDFTLDSTFLVNLDFSITETEHAVFAVWQPAKDGATGTEARSRALYSNQGSGIFIATPNSNNQIGFKRFGTIQNFALDVSNLNTINAHAFVGTSSGADYYFNGSSIYSDSLTGTNATRNDLYIGTKQNVTSHDTEGYISEFIFYNSDQSSNFFKIQSNINNHYGLYTAAEDGFVNTWYDQSGNSNNATAPADINEPQIVSAGSLLADGIDFDGSDDYLQCTSALGITTDTSAFIVVKLDTTASTQFIVDNRDGGGDGSSMYNTSDRFAHLFQSGNAQVSSSTNESLVTFEKSSTEILVAVNDGTPTTTANTDSIDVTTAPRIGTRSFSSPSSVLDGSIKEIVIYSSIQTANRSNIIDNINDHYSIF